jgi:hypothetical protein
VEIVRALDSRLRRDFLGSNNLAFFVLVIKNWYLCPSLLKDPNPKGPALVAPKGGTGLKTREYWSVGVLE